MKTANPPSYFHSLCTLLLLVFRNLVIQHLVILYSVQY